ncbi:hypothetical protein [Algoriphagus namhaensis]
MAKNLVLLLIAILGMRQTFAQNPDSLKIIQLEREIQELKTYRDNLSGSLEVTNLALNDLIRDKQVSDQTKWISLRSSLINSATLYRKLSEDIINLKSRVTDEDYQGFIKSMGSIEGGPLGFSFEEVIKESVSRIGIFESKTRMDRFLEITNSIVASPIASGIPFVSQAVFASNSLLNVAYSSIMTEKKPDYTKMSQFENELNRYLVYFSALDKANMANQNSNNDRIALLENLQLELTSRVHKESVKLGFSLPERSPTESIDTYSNRIFSIFTAENIDQYLKRVEQGYGQNSQVINYARLLQNERDLKYYANHISSVVDLSKRFLLYYDNFFEIADQYHLKVMEALDLAHKNGIIQPKKINGVEQSPQQLYEAIRQSLSSKKTARDNGIKNSINISDLKQQLERAEEFKLY